MRWALRVVLSVGLGLMGCLSPLVDPTPMVAVAPQLVQTEVDLLFVVDNSPSMRPKQDELVARFPELVKLLDDLGQTGRPASYHIGVITSDLGAGSTVVGSACKPGGQGGRLHPLGAASPNGCPAPVGKAFIEYDQLHRDQNGQPRSNLLNDKSVDSLARTLGCMASVGDGGCGFAHSLEAAYVAIRDAPSLAENQGFLRRNSLLVVVFVTDEDDCSADRNTDLFSASSAQYGRLDSYRCTRFGIMRDDPMTGSPSLMPPGDSGGAVVNPRSASIEVGQKLFPIDRYIRFFGSANAARINPGNVILVGLAAPANPVSSVLATTDSTNPLVLCNQESATCAPRLQHSCASVDNQLYGDPAVRLQAVIGSLPADRRQLASICDSSYQSALHGIGALIGNHLGPGCISSPFLADTVPPLGDSPDCTVTEIPPTDGEPIVTAVPLCKSSGGHKPCWELVRRDGPDGACPPTCEHAGDLAQRFGIEILHDVNPPAGTQAQIACRTVVVAPRDSGDPANPLGCRLQ